MVYSLWQHTRSIQGGIWIFPIAYTCTFTITGALQLSRIIYRNVAFGRSHVRLNLEPHIGDVALITLSLPRPWAVHAGQRINLGIPHVGIFYLFQTHPFAISWWENDIQGQAVSVSILLRPRSGFTRRILDRVEPNTECAAWIDGPFGPSSVNCKSLRRPRGGYTYFHVTIKVPDLIRTRAIICASSALKIIPPSVNSLRVYRPASRGQKRPSRGRRPSSILTCIPRR